MNGKRIAFVIGNGNYVHAVPLANPKNDANAMVKALADLDFEIIPGMDLSRREMETALLGFENRLANAGVSLLFFAGHGLQVKGENYLLPVDTKIENEGHLRWGAFSLTEILSIMTRRSPTSLVFLDACRNNPFTREIARIMGEGGTRELARGLAEPMVSRGSLIAFAAAPGRTAADGTGRNSPFTSALLNYIREPGLSVLDMMTKVTAEVVRLTYDRQEPWQQSNLRDLFYFKPMETVRENEKSPSVPAASTAVQLIVERQDSLVEEFALVDRVTEKAERGDADSQFELGSRFELGRGVAKDNRIAESCYLKAADQNTMINKFFLFR